MDLLSDLLRDAGVRGSAGVRAESGRDWGWWAPAGPAALHAVVRGSSWLRVGDGAPRELRAGDVALLPRGSAHAVASDPVAARRTTPDHHDHPVDERRPGLLRMGTPPYEGGVVCAHYERDAIAHPLLNGLPDLLHVRTAGPVGEGTIRGGAALADVVRLLGHELGGGREGGGVVLDRLVDVVLIELLRAWLAAGVPARVKSSLCALRDPLVGAAIGALHADPARAWTTDALARELLVSRATLARRFPAVVGETPGAYLTRHRMDLAARRLRDTDDDLPAIATAVGYASAPAFNRAFARARGASPGRWRTAARRSSASPTATRRAPAPGEVTA